jgi:hypothetical protein
MGFMNLFKRARQPTKPLATNGDELVDLACNLLATQIDLGSASTTGPNRKRLEEPYARGYVFGFVDAVLQKGGIADETHALALITVAHSKLFGVAMGSIFVGDALNDQAPDSIFTKGRGVGAADLIRWLNDTKRPHLCWPTI